MTQKILEVAALLGATTRPIERESAHEVPPYIILADGTEIFVRVGGYGNAGRIQFSGSYPSYVDADGRRQRVIPRDIWRENQRLDSPSITVAQTKTAEQIAADLRRRLLPTLQDVWAACKARCVSAEAYRDQKRQTVERVAAATGGKPTSGFECVSYGYEVGSASYRSDPEHFKVTLENVTEAQLVEILQIVRPA